MAIDTKPNFNSGKFEQCSGDIMNLSGCTQIYGSFDIETGAILTICENAGLGKVLTSDETGIATWQTSSGGLTAISGGSGMNFSPITSTGEIILGTPTTIINTSTNISSGITHNHTLNAGTFVTGTQGILVDGSNRFYLDDIYIANAVLPNLYTINAVNSNQSLGTLPSGQTLGMIYITNTGSTQVTLNFGTTPTGNDITPFEPIVVDPDEDISVTVNMRLSLTEDKTIYVNSLDWTNVSVNIQWAHISYDNVPLPTGGTGISLWEAGSNSGITTINSNGIIEVSEILPKYIEGNVKINNICIGYDAIQDDSSLIISSLCNVTVQVDNDLILTSSSGTGGTYICYLPNKTTETCGLYINSSGKISTGIISGGTGGVPAGIDGSIQYNNSGVFGGFDYINYCCGTINYIDVGDSGLMQGPIITSPKGATNDNVWNINGNNTGNPDECPLLDFNIITGFTISPISNTILKLKHDGIQMPVLPSKTSETCGIYIDVNGNLSKGIVSSGTSIGGIDGSVQYNNGGTLGGTCLNWDDSTNTFGWNAPADANTRIRFDAGNDYQEGAYMKAIEIGYTPDTSYEPISQLGYKCDIDGYFVTYLCAPSYNVGLELASCGRLVVKGGDISTCIPSGYTGALLLVNHCTCINNNVTVGNSFQLQACGTFKPPLTLNANEPTVDAYTMRIWIDTDDSNRVYLLYNNGSVTKKVELI